MAELPVADVNLNVGQQYFLLKRNDIGSVPFLVSKHRVQAYKILSLGIDNLTAPETITGTKRERSSLSLIGQQGLTGFALFYPAISQCCKSSNSGEADQSNYSQRSSGELK